MFNLEIISRWDSRLNICFYKKFVSVSGSQERVSLKWDGRRLVIVCLCGECTQNLFIRWWMKNDMQQVYRAEPTHNDHKHLTVMDSFH